MDITVSSLRSRVSRRIFLLFFLAAFVPIALISAISYKHINSQMTQQTQAQLHRETRTIGHGFFDRLVSVQSILSSIAVPMDPSTLSPQALNEKFLQGKVRDINALSPTGELRVLRGAELPVPELSQAQRGHLAKGNGVVALMEINSRKRLILVSNISSPGPSMTDSSLLLASPDPDYLYNFGVVEPQLACVLSKSGEIIDCTSPVSAADIAGIQTTGTARREFQDWRYNNENYTVHVWDLFLAGHFQSEDVGILLAFPNRSILGDLNSFNTIFPKTLILTGLLVVVLSITSIRRNLDPLKELLLGTNRIMNGEYRTPVKIKGDGEFASLAGSFNNMAQRIDEQIRTLTMMSRIDRMILSSHDARQIIHVLIEYGHTAFPVSHIAVFAFDSEDISRSSVTMNTDETFSDARTDELHIDAQQIERFDVQADYLWLAENKKEEILTPLRNMGDRCFLVFPLKVKSKITGLICLANPVAFEVDEVRLKELRDLADRVAVALSNAAWEDKLYYQAHYDAVTGLPNRYLLKDRLDQAVAKTLRADTNIAVLLIDLDKFKDVNDTLGHEVGDELLLEVGQRLTSCVRSSDTLARFGGDEFIILMDTEEDAEGIINRASQLARRIQHHFKTPFHMHGRELYISSSIGISVCPGNSQNVDDLLKQADSAMYHAKHEGRAQFRFFDEALNTELVKKMSLESDMRMALERNEFILMYQPKVAADGGRLVGAETLLRWKHPKLGFISPEQFIPIAEESGMIVDIGTWILRSACMQNKAWQAEGFEDFHLSVNVSGVQFRQANFVELVKEILTESGLPPALLDIEITESVTIQDYDSTISLLEELHNLGVRISIDDFGTGYSSMSYLNQFKVDKIKIDKSFVDGIPEFESSLSIVHAIIALAHSLNFTVVAEGIEKLEQYAFLVNSGVDEIQGFYVSRPLPRAEFEHFYETYEAERIDRNIKRAGLN